MNIVHDFVLKIDNSGKKDDTLVIEKKNSYYSGKNKEHAGEIMFNDIKLHQLENGNS